MMIGLKCNFRKLPIVRQCYGQLKIGLGAAATVEVQGIFGDRAYGSVLQYLTTCSGQSQGTGSRFMRRMKDCFHSALYFPRYRYITRGNVSFMHILPAKLFEDASYGTPISTDAPRGVGAMPKP